MLRYYKADPEDVIRHMMQKSVDAEYDAFCNKYFNYDAQCQDAVEGRSRFARPNIPRPSKAIGE